MLQLWHLNFCVWGIQRRPFQKIIFKLYNNVSIELIILCFDGACFYDADLNVFVNVKLAEDAGFV